MIQQNYEKYMRADGDALLRAYVGPTVIEANKDETETFSSGTGNRSIGGGSVPV
jgi:hypothetical protein